jgi:hypothetical protein
MKMKIASAALAVIGLTTLAAPAAGAAPAAPAGGHIAITIGSPTTCTPINLVIARITLCY